MITQLRSTAQLIKAGAWSDIWQVTRAYWRSDSQTVGLRRDMTIPFTSSRAAIPLTVRELRRSDLPHFFPSEGPKLSGEAMRERSIRQRMTDAGLATCYVAVTENDAPCYVQWLIGAEQNSTLRSLFGDRFPDLAHDEMLLEGAFTIEAWRGKGVMAAAMSQIAEKAPARDARWVITFVGTDNIPSLKGCKKAGFEPYLSRTDQWRRFHHTSRFGPLATAAD